MFGLFKKKRKQNNNVVSTQTTDLPLSFSAVPATVDIDEKRLVPLKDERILSLVSNVAPNKQYAIINSSGTIGVAEVSSLPNFS